MLDSTQPHDVFSGKDDLYRLLRETRAAVNLLSDRMTNIELFLAGEGGSINTVSEDEIEQGSAMSNTKGNSGMVPNRVGKKKRK